MRSLTMQRAVLAVCACAVLVPATLGAARAGSSFIGPLTVSAFSTPTIPGNGDVNPYGTAVVPRTVGDLVQGNVLVSNFNNSGGNQGTGTTIVQIAPNGSMSLFAQIDPDALPQPCPGGVGLTTALVVLRSGWVIVGSLPTTDGTAATAKAGCLIVLDSSGDPVEVFSGHLINGPWDMTAFDGGRFAFLYFTNVLNGTVAAGGHVVRGGTVVQMALLLPPNRPPQDVFRLVVGSGFPERTDPNALVIGPTGLGLIGAKLYVADTLANRIAVLPISLFAAGGSGAGKTVSMGGALNGPLGLAMAPNGNILTVNGGDGNIVETTPTGVQVAVKTLDSSGNPPGAGALFGLAVTSTNDGVWFVDDATNTLMLLN